MYTGRNASDGGASWVRLRDGRRLGYAEYGDPAGKPVLHLHGLLSSRLEGCAKGVSDTAAQVHARLITPDRPGMGLSDFKPGRTILDWPDDVVELADALQLDRFAIVGVSGGGPYAAACALKIPQRLTAVGIVSGLGPLQVPHATEGMYNRERWLFTIARPAPRLGRLLLAWMSRDIQRDSLSVVSQIWGQLAEPDRETVAHPDVRDMLCGMAKEAFRSGASGPAWDVALVARPWGFSLRDIPMEVNLWQGGRDCLVPPSMGRYQAHALLKCCFQFYPEEGHVSLVVNHCGEILDTLVRE